MADVDLQAEIQKAVDEATKGLKAKNDELLGKLKEVKSKFGDVDLDSLKSKASELDSLKEAEMKRNKEYDKLIETMREQHKGEVSSLKDKLAAEERQNTRFLVDQQLKDALASVNVNPKMLEVATRVLKDDVAIIEQDGSRVARVGDKKISEHVSEWAKTDTGKMFIMAPENTGGGAHANADDHAGAMNGDWEKYFKKDGPHYNLTKQAQLHKENMEEWARLDKKYNG